ncbi:MAG: hypothetical protein V4719_13645 [Planctomycetota bacterium]
MVRSTRILAALLSLAFVPVLSSPVQAQGKKAAEFIPGTVVSIEKDKTGRNYKMKFKSSADDTEFDVPLKPTTQLAVTVQGDETFLRPNVTILTSALAGANNQYSAKDFTVFIGAAPAPHLIPDPKKVPMVFEMCGKVLAKDAEGLMVQCGPQPKKVLFESGVTVAVKISDPALIKVGDGVEVEGILIKSKNLINAISVSVTPLEPINADEYFASLEERKKSKSSKSKTSKAKTDAAEGAAGGDSDPFGVLKGKKGATKSKTDKAAAEDDAKPDSAKKDTEAKDKDKPAEKKD